MSQRAQSAWRHRDDVTRAQLFFTLAGAVLGVMLLVAVVAGLVHAPTGVVVNVMSVGLVTAALCGVVGAVMSIVEKRAAYRRNRELLAEGAGKFRYPTWVLGAVWFAGSVAVFCALMYGCGALIDWRYGHHPPKWALDAVVPALIVYFAICGAMAFVDLQWLRRRRIRRDQGHSPPNNSNGR